VATKKKAKKQENEKFYISIPVEVIFDPNRTANSMLFRMSETEVTISKGKGDKEIYLGYAGAALGGTLVAGVGEYTCISRALEFWTAVKAELEKRHDDVFTAKWGKKKKEVKNDSKKKKV